MLCHGTTDDHRARALRPDPHGGQHSLAVRWVDEGHQLALVGHLQWVQSQESAGRGHRLWYWDLRLVKFDTDT